MTRVNVQYAVEYLQEQLHFQYFRVWNVFSKKLMLTDGSEKSSYNYDMIYQVFDFFVQHHLKPFIDFGRRLDTALGSSGEAIYNGEEYVRFVSRKAWENMVSDFILTMKERYGDEEVSGWIFELSFNVNNTDSSMQLYEDPEYSFYHAYQYLYHCVKERLPRAKIGGISAVVEKERERLKHFLIRSKKDGCPPDFISFLLFSSELNRNTKGSHQTVPRELSLEQWSIQSMHHLLEETGLEDRKLFITEWNNSISNRNYLNDSCFRAAYIVKKIEEIGDQVDLLCVMSGTDWVSNYLDTFYLVNGGIGILTKDNIRKPVFFALEFLDYMGGHLLAKNEHCIATKAKNGDLYLLCFYFSPVGNRKLNEDSIGLKEYSKGKTENEKPLHLDFIIQNLEASGNYIVKERILDRDSGSILDEWGRFQYEMKLTRRDVKYLQAVSFPKQRQSRIQVNPEARELHLQLDLISNEVHLLHLYHEK